jgi:hypothetical protein
MDSKPKARSPAAKKKAAKIPKEKTQKQRFIEAARAIGVDESGWEFENALVKIVKMKKEN